jgi:uncharacterized membrane protein
VSDQPTSASPADDEPLPDRSDMRSCSDGWRAMWAVGAAVVVPVVLGFVLPSDLEALQGTGRQFLLALIGWNVFCVVYVIHTHRAFARVDKREFLARMSARDRLENAFWRKVSPYGDGPTFAIEATVVSFFVVLVVPHLKGVQINPWVLVPLTLSILLCCWALSIVSYTLHYAQKDIATPSLDFPGDRTGAYGDYLYFSIAVSTTFGATDVNITQPAMRKVVNLHTILVFLYNSVIVALLASLLIR